MFLQKNHSFTIRNLIFFILISVFLSCTSNNQSIEITPVVSEYYKTYQINKNFERFIDFYAEEIELEDIINGDKIKGKENLKKFFNWNNPNLSRNDSLALIIEDQIIDKNKVVTKGYFTSFKWNETQVEAMHFTSILYFNESKKIIRQVDWINYPSSLVDYKNRNNSNNWILNN
ncbi:MAG: hypothetical protein AB8F94_23045 [Saprospiraceae bacterium]